MDDLSLLTAKLINEGFSQLPPDVILEDELQRARDFINLRRTHTATAELPVPAEYARLVTQLAMSSIVRTGAKSQTAHAENGVTRTYGDDGDYPLNLRRQVLFNC